MHGATALKSVAASDNKGQIVSTQLGVGVGGVGVGVAGRSEDGAALDTRLFSWC